MTQDFSNQPESITEAVSRRTGDPRKWTPRDTLIAALREIDSGELENVDAVTVCIRENHGEEGTYTRFFNMGPDVQTSLGLLEMVKRKMLDVLC